MSHPPNNRFESTPSVTPSLNVPFVTSDLVASNHPPTLSKSPRALPTIMTKMMRDPNAWKEYERNIAQILSSTTHPELVDFPKDDIQINIIPRPVNISDELSNATFKLPKHMLDMVEIFSRKWVQVEYTYRQNYGGGSLLPIYSSKKLPELRFEVDITGDDSEPYPRKYSISDSSLTASDSSVTKKHTNISQQAAKDSAHTMNTSSVTPKGPENVKKQPLPNSLSTPPPTVPTSGMTGPPPQGSQQNTLPIGVRPPPPKVVPKNAPQSSAPKGPTPPTTLPSRPLPPPLTSTTSPHVAPAVNKTSSVSRTSSGGATPSGNPKQSALLSSSTTQKRNTASSEQSMPLTQTDISRWLCLAMLQKGDKDDAAMRTQRTKERVNLFHVYTPREPLPPPTDQRRFDTVWEYPKPTITFVFRPKTILWNMGDIEPIYFVSAALYDIDTHSKISETVHFDLSSRNLLQKHAAEFSISYISASIYLLIRVEKVLQGDLDTLLECYSTSVHTKEADKIKEEAQSIFQQYLGRYRQFMCWSALQLFDEETEQFLEANDRRIPLYKAKGVDDNILWDYSTNKEFKKLHPMNGGMIVDLEQLNKEIASGDLTKQKSQRKTKTHQESKRRSRHTEDEDEDSNSSTPRSSMDKETSDKQKRHSHDEDTEDSKPKKKALDRSKSLGKLRSGSISKASGSKFMITEAIPPPKEPPPPLVPPPQSPHDKVNDSKPKEDLKPNVTPLNLPTQLPQPMNSSSPKGSRSPLPESLPQLSPSAELPPSVATVLPPLPETSLPPLNAISPSPLPENTLPSSAATELPSLNATTPPSLPQATLPPPLVSSSPPISTSAANIILPPPLSEPTPSLLSETNVSPLNITTSPPLPGAALPPSTATILPPISEATLPPSNVTTSPPLPGAALPPATATILPPPLVPSPKEAPYQKVSSTTSLPRQINISTPTQDVVSHKKVKSASRDDTKPKRTISKEEIQAKEKENEKAEQEEDIDYRIASELYEKGKIPYVNITYKNYLYIYPLSIKFPTKKGGSGASKKNICCRVELRNSDDLTQSPLPRIYQRSGVLGEEFLTTITYHDKRPNYYDEIKIELPPILSPQHHLLFSFYHIPLKEGKKKYKDEKEILLGQSILHLFQERVIEDKVHELPVAAPLASGYNQPQAQKNIKWMEGKKEIFAVRTMLISSVMTNDPILDGFFKAYNGTDRVALTKAIATLKKVDSKKLIQFSPLLMHQFVTVMCARNWKTSQGLTTTDVNPSFEAFLAILHVLPLVEKAIGKHPLDGFIYSFLTNCGDSFDDKNSPSLDAVYSQYSFVFEEVVKHWHTICQADHPMKQLSIQYAWFFLGVIAKSMVLYVVRYKMQTPRESRFSSEFLHQLKILLLMLLTAVKRDWARVGLETTHSLCKSIAYFLNDCWTIMDRGFLLEIVRSFMKLMNVEIPNLFLSLLRLTFLRVITDYEHYVPLNVPHDISIHNVDVIQKDFKKKHYLSGLLLVDAHKMITSDVTSIRTRVLSILRNILWKHEFDDRYKDKHLIYAMYFPIIVTIVEATEKEVLDKLPVSELREWLLCFMTVMKNANRELLKSWLHKESNKRRIAFFQALRYCAEAFEYVPKEQIVEHRRQERPLRLSVSSHHSNPPGSSEKVAAVPSATNPNPPKSDTIGTEVNFYPLNLMGEITEILLGKSQRIDAQAVLKDRSPVISKKSAPTRVTLGLEFDHRGKNDPGTTAKSLPINLRKESHLSAEVSSIILDVVADFVVDFREELNTKDNELMPHFMKLLIKLLQKNQAENVLSNILWFLRGFIRDFSKPLFKYGDNTYVADLCSELLRMCNFKSHVNRSEAVAILYLMMKKNYKECKNLSLMKLQVTVAVSKLVAATKTKDFKRLHEGLEVLGDFGLTQAEKYKNNPEKYEKAKHFGQQLKEFSKSLHVVLNNCIRINDFRFDPDITAELFYETSLGYTNSPELRISWLDNLASFFVEQKSYEEAAQCKLYVAYLVNQVLRFQRKNDPYGLEGLPEPSMFKAVTTNADGEPPLPDLSPLEEELANSRTFTDRNLMDLLFISIEYLNQAKLYEAAMGVYNLLIPLMQKKAQYGRLSICYQDLVGICKILNDPHMSEARIWALYYRVMFYGPKWGEFDGKEYIYKAPVGVRIVDMTQRLTTQFEGQFGKGKVQVLPLKEINRSELNPQIAYFQIASVTPYHNEEELSRRNTQWARNFNITCFLWERMLVQDAKIQVPVKERRKVKTFLYTKIPFPYLKTRLEVVRREQVILSPLETAIDLIEEKVNALREQLDSPAVNAKALQMVLSGTISPRMNLRQATL